MGATLEGAWTREFTKDFEKMGAIVWVLSGNTYGTNGVPDRWICTKYWSAFMEFKNVDGTCSPHQTRCLRKVFERNKVGAFIFRKTSKTTKSGTLFFACDIKMRSPIAERVTPATFLETIHGIIVAVNTGVVKPERYAS